MAVLRLPRLPTRWQEQPQLFERYWDEAMKKIEDNLNSLLTIPGIQAAIIAAQATADAANTTATTVDTRTASSRLFLDSAR